MKLSIKLRPGMHRTASYVQVALLLAMTGTSVWAKNDSPCPSESTAKPGWTVFDNSSASCVYVKPGTFWAKYARVELQPSSFERTVDQDVREDEAKKLTTFLDEKLRSAFSEQKPNDGPSLTIRPVITAIRRSTSAANAISTAVIKVPVSYGGATVRFELVDTSSGETVGVIIDERRGRPWNGFQGLRALGHSRVVLNGSAKRVRNDTDRLRRAVEPARLTTTADE